MLPTSTNVRIEVKTKVPAESQAIVVFAAEGGKVSGDTTLVLRSAEFESAQRMLKMQVVRGKAREVDFDLLESPPGVVRRVFVAGLGPAEKMTTEVVRQAAGAALRAV